MLDVLAQTIPFFVVVALGFGAAARGAFSAEATAALTRFVFYFALSAMLFRFAARLDLAEVFDPTFTLAYVTGTGAVYLLVTAVALLRRRGVEEAAIEAQCGVVGNVGFLGVPMLTLLLGDEAIGPVMMVLSADLIVFGSLIVIIISARRDGRLRPAVLLSVARGLAANPMIVSIVAGLAWSATGWPLPGVARASLELLGNAATPGALFAIGASLAGRSADHIAVPGWLAFSKLALHPLAVAVMAFVVLPVEPYAAGVMVACAALPVAGNVYILAQHYGIVPKRASAAILLSTAASVLSVPAVIAWVQTR
ncbi:MAG: AEC family transporter [Alphaproteobacteria bacterium]|nr:MAG: AEC family transporter [Alphaproteobacteria bacterium]